MRALLYKSVIAAGLIVTASTAEADRTMVVVVDATGSMETLRNDPDNPTGPQIQRFELARRLAARRVNDAATVDPLGLAGGVQVFTFSGSSMTPWDATGPAAAPVVLTPGQARSTILNNIAVTPFSTPLADSICSAATFAGTSGTGATTVRFLEVFSDGGENSSSGVDCSGPYAATPDFPWTPGSWERKTYDFVTTTVPSLSTVRGNFTLLFDDVTTLARKAASAGAASDVAATETAKSNVRALAADGPPTDNEFFAQLAVGTNGVFTEIADLAQPPVTADIDGTFAVDRNDAIKVARNFGGPASATFDLNQDGKVGYGDYAIVKGLLGTGTGTPAPDPYTTSNVLTCRFGQHLVIDGKAVEDAGPTVIDADNLCVITIKNSLIVSGNFAIKARGLLTVTVDDSIIVGENSWLTAAPLSLVIVNAKNTVFHGKTSTPYVYVSRGGNTFE